MSLTFIVKLFKKQSYMNLNNILAGVLCMGLTIPAIAQDRMQGDRYEDRRSNNPYNRPNILALAPIQFTENGVAGVSVSYEHAFDERGIVAFYAPAVLEFNLSNTENTNNTNRNSDPMFYVMPGIKIYPTGCYGYMAKYAIGPSLVIAEGQRTVSAYPYYNSYDVRSHFVFGMIINQSLNINPTPWLYIGSEFGLGFSYIDRVGGESQGVKALVNFNFKIGYRF